MSVRCLLWDFGDTLFEELSLWRGSEDWMAIYRSFSEAGGLGERWSRGDIDDEQAIAEIATRFNMNPDSVRAHLNRTDLFVPHAFTLGFFQRNVLPQAIVTINPALFRTLAVKLGLDQFVETMAISGEARTLDKRPLCRLALDNMLERYTPEEALLIDNSRTHVEAWRSEGGSAYHYRGDELFREHVGEGVEYLAAK